MRRAWRSFCNTFWRSAYLCSAFLHRPLAPYAVWSISRRGITARGAVVSLLVNSHKRGPCTSRRRNNTRLSRIAGIFMLLYFKRAIFLAASFCANSLYSRLSSWFCTESYFRGKTMLLLLVLTSSHQYNAVTDTDRISMHSHITRQLLRLSALVVVLPP